MPNEVVLGRDLGFQILKAIGYPPAMVQSVTIDCKALDVATITIRRLIDGFARDEIVRVLQRYEGIAAGD